MLLVNVIRAKYKILANLILIFGFIYSTKNCWSFYDVNSGQNNFGCMVPAFYLGGGTIGLAILINIYWGIQVFKHGRNYNIMQSYLLFIVVIVWVLIFTFIRTHIA